MKTLKTNSKGKAELYDLPLGKYQLKEVSSPNGYMIDVEVLKKTTTNVKPIQTFSLYDNRQNIKLTVQKIDAKSEEKLSGGNFN